MMPRPGRSVTPGFAAPRSADAVPSFEGHDRVCVQFSLVDNSE